MTEIVAKKPYETPAVVPLGALAVGSGTCTIGGGVDAYCKNGTYATSCGDGIDHTVSVCDSGAVPDIDG
jgi:hypothetical protein